MAYPKREIVFDENKSKKILKIKKLEVGDKFYTMDGYLNHIISFTSDEDYKLVVYKCWLKYKGYWGYYIKGLNSLLYEICITNDIPKNKRKEFYEINGINPAGWV